MQLLQSLAILGAVCSVSAYTINMYPAESCETSLISWTATSEACVNINIGESVRSIKGTDVGDFEIVGYHERNCVRGTDNYVTTTITSSNEGDCEDIEVLLIHEAILSIKITSTST
ncbi:hypothetical protein N7490_007989 [Penicillium lividum]|nr:hypothetical protein N7490_007989 [Penicillium lividum]